MARGAGPVLLLMLSAVAAIYRLPDIALHVSFKLRIQDASFG